jgi:putative transposase
MATKQTRKSNRLPFKTIYISNNAFFITICVAGRICCLSEIFDRKASLSPTGKIVEESWLSLTNLVNDIQLDEFVIMPNHFHGIFTFLNTPTFKNSERLVDLSQIMAIFKSKTTNLIRRGKPSASHDNRRSLASQDNMVYNGKASLTPTNIPIFHWQKSFFDHVIRDEEDLLRVQEYILNNPLQWELDILNPKNEDEYQRWIASKLDSN